MNALIRVRAELQWVQSEIEPERREIAYGEAYAVMLSTADTEIVKEAEKVMHREGWGGSKNEKLDAIDTAIQRIGHLIDQIMHEQ